MSHSNQSYLRFSLEESVWFQKGQEVDELISISLDPNITINESDQYVTIKGTLELHGEYQREEYEDNEVENEFFSNPKFIQNVEVREEGGSFFTHHFPVEITIPKNRIDDIENIDVAVESFDYAFPERSCLRLSADLMITGLYGEQQHAFFQEQEDEFIDEDDEFELNEEETEEYEVRTEELEDLLETEFHEEDSEDYTEILLEEDSSDDPPAYMTADDQEEEWEREEEEHIYEPFSVEARKEAKAEETLKSLTEELDREEIIQEEIHQLTEEEEPIAVIDDSPSLTREESEEPAFEEEDESPITTAPDIFFLAKRNEQNDNAGAAQDTAQPTEQQIEVVNENEPADEEEEIEEEAAPVKGKKKWKKKQSLSITEFLARKEETADAHTRLRVCIVQKGDTIDTLSERYDISVNHLQRVNNLEINQDVYEGQVLYIPVGQKQK